MCAERALCVPESALNAVFTALDGLNKPVSFSVSQMVELEARRRSEAAGRLKAELRNPNSSVSRAVGVQRVAVDRDVTLARRVLLGTADRV